MTAIMKSAPTPSDREVLTGLVERVTYQNAENGFCVLRVKIRGHRELGEGIRRHRGRTPPTAGGERHPVR